MTCTRHWLVNRWRGKNVGFHELSSEHPVDVEIHTTQGEY